MKFRSRLLAMTVAALLMPVAALAADTTQTEKEPAREKAEPKKAEAAAATCDKVTGSRIKPTRETSCEKASNRPIRTYTADELRNTGETDLGAALRKLDPSFQ
jgi:hypothetical protein